MSDIIGMDRLLRQLGAIEDLDYVQAAAEGMQIVVEYAQLLAPVDTGELQESIGLEFENDTVSIVADSDHAAPIEFGTAHMAAQPYLRPAIDTRGDEAVALMARNLETQIKEKV